ncbi:MAG: hypothetical protein Q8L39_04775 [Burkholderiales bacterium]|nr:hypothetical protein [Burkholderiales bacterium]
MSYRIANWPDKAPAEKVWLTFKYKRGLAPGESVTSVAMIVTLKGGVDASPALILDGVPVLLADGRVMQRIKDGIHLAAYMVLCKATTSTGQILVLAGVIPVREIA